MRRLSTEAPVADASRLLRGTAMGRGGHVGQPRGGGGGGLGFGGVFRTVVGLAIGGATAVVVESTLNDIVLWRICKSHAMPVIDAHPRLQRSLAGPEAASYLVFSILTRQDGGIRASS